MRGSIDKQPQCLTALLTILPNFGRIKHVNSDEGVAGADSARQVNNPDISSGLPEDDPVKYCPIARLMCNWRSYTCSLNFQKDPGMAEAVPGFYTLRESLKGEKKKWLFQFFCFW